MESACLMLLSSYGISAFDTSDVSIMVYALLVLGIVSAGSSDGIGSAGIGNGICTACISDGISDTIRRASTFNGISNHISNGISMAGTSYGIGMAGAILGISTTETSHVIRKAGTSHGISAIGTLTVSAQLVPAMV